MARRYRTHLPRGESADKALTPRYLNRQEFANRLYNLMHAKGWHQSELARRAGLPRDSISAYVRARSMPSPVNLEKLAAALGVPADRLLANHTEAAIADDTPAFELKISLHSPDAAWVRLNRLMSTKTALKIAALLGEEDGTAERSGGDRAVALQPGED